ncbi:unnamed protein product, partial [Polarella glacialis]
VGQSELAIGASERHSARGSETRWMGCSSRVARDWLPPLGHSHSHGGAIFFCAETLEIALDRRYGSGSTGSSRDSELSAGSAGWHRRAAGDIDERENR